MDLEKLVKALLYHKYFVNDVFSQSFNDFIGGEYVDKVADFLEFKKTMRVSARDHFKSTSLYSHFLKESMKNAHKDLEGHYFSFKQKMAGYHIAKIKKLKEANPEFNSCIDKKPNAENIIKYTWDGIHFHTLQPHGLLSFKRGIHADLIYIDDPFQDPASKLVTTVIEKINLVIKTQVLDMVKKRGQIHIVGTPQTSNDFFFDPSLRKHFRIMISPAEVDHLNKIALWPEWMNWEELMLRKEQRGEKIYNQEYLCSPAYTEEAFFTKEKLYSVVGNKKSLDYKVKHNLEGDIIAGMDLGKKRHPSHVSIFQVINGKWSLIFQKFLDHWDYSKQLEFCQLIIENFGIDYLYYDNTRGEFESFQERDELPSQMQPVSFTNKVKNSMATQFDTLVSAKKIDLINDKRFLEQILLVDNDLNAVETKDGHADSFWSTCLALNHLNQQGEPELTIV